MPTPFAYYFQAEGLSVSGVLVLLIPAAVASLGWFFQWKKYRSDTSLAVMEKLPTFLLKLEEAHARAIADRQEMAELREGLKKALAENVSCRKLKMRVVSFLDRLEPIIQHASKHRQLLREVQQWKGDLSNSLEEENGGQR